MQSFKRRWRDRTPRPNKGAREGYHGSLRASAVERTPHQANNPLNLSESPFFRYEIPFQHPQCASSPPAATFFRYEVSQQEEHISRSHPAPPPRSFFRFDIPERIPPHNTSAPSTPGAFFRFEIPDNLTSPMETRATVTRALTEPLQLERLIDADPEEELTEDVQSSLQRVFHLPAYSPSAGEDEQVIGREGERGGIDVLLEPPDTAEEEEARRESEMEALYQIRVQRRRELADTQQRRERRRQARDRGDTAELIRLAHITAYRHSERERYGTTAMIQALRSTSYERRVGSVSYADLGVVRHGGTCIIPDSTVSVQRPFNTEYPAQHVPGTTTPASGRDRSLSVASVLSTAYAGSAHSSTGTGHERRSSAVPLSPVFDNVENAPPYDDRNFFLTSTPPAYESLALSREMIEQNAQRHSSNDWRSNMGLNSSASRSRVAPVM